MKESNFKLYQVDFGLIRAKVIVAGQLWVSLP